MVTLVILALSTETATSSPPAAPDGYAWSRLAGVLQTAASGHRWAGHCINSCTPPPPITSLPSEVTSLLQAIQNQLHIQGT